MEMGPHQNKGNFKLHQIFKICWHAGKFTVIGSEEDWSKNEDGFGLFFAKPIYALVCSGGIYI